MDESGGRVERSERLIRSRTAKSPQEGRLNLVMSGRGGYRWALSCMCALVGILTAAASGGVASEHSEGERSLAERTRRRPNFVVIVTDDQRADTMWAMPRVRRRLANRGVWFKDGYVSNSLCCPSRASILTGRYSHSTGVYTNSPPGGGYQAFEDESTVATWLNDAGYRTGLMGKYFNGYSDANYVPPGWDKWNAFVDDNGEGGRFFDYELSVDGRVQKFGHAPNDYSTDVLARKSRRFIRRSDRPFFLYFAPFAPHGDIPAPRHRDAFEDVELDPTPSYNEQNVDDKPQWVRRLERLDRFGPRPNVLETLIAVDDAVASMTRLLRRTGELRRTFIVFTSDHGRGWGEHRWRDKSDPYRGSTRVPFIIRYDRLIERRRIDRHLVLNLDLAPTIAKLARVDAPGAEGKNLARLLRSRRADWRRDFLLEHLEDKRGIPSYCGVRTKHKLYVAYATGEEELYLLSNDPYELRNRAYDVSFDEVLERLRTRVRQLCSPPPPGFVFPAAGP